MDLGVLPSSPQRVLITLEQKNPPLSDCYMPDWLQSVMDISHFFFSCSKLCFLFLWYVSFALTGLWSPPNLACKIALFGDPAVMHSEYILFGNAGSRRLCFSASYTSVGVVL